MRRRLWLTGRILKLGILALCCVISLFVNFEPHWRSSIGSYFQRHAEVDPPTGFKYVPIINASPSIKHIFAIPNSDIFLLRQLGSRHAEAFNISSTQIPLRHVVIGWSQKLWDACGFDQFTFNPTAHFISGGLSAVLDIYVGNQNTRISRVKSYVYITGGQVSPQLSFGGVAPCEIQTNCETGNYGSNNVNWVMNQPKEPSTETRKKGARYAALFLLLLGAVSFFIGKNSRSFYAQWGFFCGSFLCVFLIILGACDWI